MKNKEVLLNFIGDNRSALEKAINGALRSAIDAHGDIKRENISSASKRILGALKEVVKSGN